MNKTAIKNFAIEARRKLIASVKDKAGRIGITTDNISQPSQQGHDFAIFSTHIGVEVTLAGKELKQRENLVKRIKEKGYEPVMEEVAYTWFNRIIAVRFMEVNDYLPSRTRVLSSETKGKFEPDLVTQAPKIDLNLFQQEVDEILTLKEKNELDKLFRLLFIKQCNELGEILPELFENTSRDDKDYTEILLDISFTHEDGVIRDLLKIEEEDFLEAVEIIGWMYQYYNTEPKAVVDAYVGKKKVPKEDVPAKTQLFTPDWIVRYMVENSLGRIWLEGHPNTILQSNWEYYLDEAEQEPDVVQKLEKIRTQNMKDNPEEIKVLDPAMGSGHILVYAFDVLMQIYESCGYSQRDAAKLIIEKNLYGLDIDDRAYQLAYFAVMMKGRKYDRRFLNKSIIPNLCAIQESNGLTSFEQGVGQLEFDSLHRETANYLVSVFRDAKEYGSILNIEEKDYNGLYGYIEELQHKDVDDLFMSIWLNNISLIMLVLIRQAMIMVKKYDVVITNPPYFSGPDMSLKLSAFVKENFPNSKTDMFAVFIEKVLQMSKTSGFIALITMHSWMFLSSYENLRTSLMTEELINMVHLGARAFDEISGEVVQTTAFVFRNQGVENYRSTFMRLVDYKGEKAKKEAFLEKKHTSAGIQIAQKESFCKIPGKPIAYWVSNLEIFDFPLLSNQLFSGGRNKTHNNQKYVRRWWEIVDRNRWTAYANGGEFKKWYGNHIELVDWSQEAKMFYEMHGGLCNKNYWNKEGITWGAITSGSNGFKIKEAEFIFSSASPTIFNNEYCCDLCVLGFLNTKVTNYLIKLFNPTMNQNVNDTLCLPYNVAHYNVEVFTLVQQNISISKNDWNSFETSWNFIKHPLVQKKIKVSDHFVEWQQFTGQQFRQLKANEEELNRIFIEIYGLQDELTPEVEDKDITIRKADFQRDIRSFVSYAIGCMFGRYSLDVEGLVYAGGDWDDSKYETFIPDKDNVIPITDEEYFDDDIVGRFITFVKVVYGEDTLEENLDFIAQALGNRGSTSREIIRNYFLKDFYKDHVKTYQKRPIYWLFDSGKENGFKALIYLHRYNQDTVGRVRADYLHKIQTVIESAISHCDLVLESNVPAPEKAKTVKKREKLVKQLAETRIYDQAIAHVAHQRIPLDLDDGVLVNYAKFQGLVVASEGKKPVKIDLLGKIK